MGGSARSTGGAARSTGGAARGTGGAARGTGGAVLSTGGAQYWRRGVSDGGGAPSNSAQLLRQIDGTFSS